MKRRSFVISTVILLIMISLPYAVGIIAGNQELRFSGLILNPVDGYTYFAKMNQGYHGDWLFHLPFTAEPGKPVFLFFFYILLGHITKLIQLPIGVIYHLTRLFGFLFLAVQSWQFIEDHVSFTKLSKTWCYVYLMFASGMGWIALLLGYESGDFVIPEAYPFYASFINPHFPWSLGLMLFIINWILSQEKRHPIPLFLSTIVLAVVMPFGSVILCVLLSAYWIIQNKEEKKSLLQKILVICLPAAVIVGFQYFETISHPALAIWNTQNETPTPPIWDILLSFSPFILFAFYSTMNWKEYSRQKSYQLMLIWFVICWIMIFMPFSFQRRFMFGLSIPVTVLGLFGLEEILERVKKADRMRKLVFSLPVVTISMLLIISFFAIISKSNYSYISASEMDIYELLSSSYAGKVVLADPDIAVKIPGFTNNLVFYGHPYETVDAMSKKAMVDRWFACEKQSDIQFSDQLLDNKIDLVVIKSEEYDGSCFTSLNVLYRNNEYLLLGVKE